MASTGFRTAIATGIAALAVGGATLALGGVAANVVGAQQAPTASPTPRSAPPTTSPGGDKQAHHEQFLNALAAKLNVSPDRLKQAMDETRRELGIPDRPRGGFGMHGGAGFGRGLEVAAGAVGLSVEQLRQELPGKTLADVARSHNVDPTTVANALKADANARIDQAAAAGRITADQVAQAKQRAAERIDQLMTRQAPAGGLPQRGQQT
jgi:hypothetical protein